MACPGTGRSARKSLDNPALMLANINVREPLHSANVVEQLLKEEAVANGKSW